jgi:exosortase
VELTQRPTTASGPRPGLDATFVAAGSVLLAAVVWSCWPMLTLFSRRWDSDPMYSHGYLVPLMAIGLVWLRGVPIADRELRPSWLGLPLLLAGLLVRHLAAAWYYEWIEWIALLPILSGVALSTVGVRLFRHLWPAIAFLVFMIPLPYRAELLIQTPMQQLVTVSSTFILQTAGLAAHSQGNVVVIGGTPIGIAEACSGLRMLTGFLALGVAAGLIIERDLIRRSLLMASTVPIALLCNIVRVTATSVVYAETGSEQWQRYCHDGFGLLMPVMGGLSLCGVLKLLDALFIDEHTSPDSATSGVRATAVKSSREATRQTGLFDAVADDQQPRHATDTPLAELVTASNRE